MWLTKYGIASKLFAYAAAKGTDMFVVEVYNPDKHATHYAVFNNMQDAKRCAMENFKEDDKISVIRVQAKETMVIWDPNA